MRQRHERHCSSTTDTEKKQRAARIPENKKRSWQMHFDFESLTEKQNTKNGEKRTYKDSNEAEK